MGFPKKPRTCDEIRAELLRLMGVSGSPGIYVLGCFAKYVTVYSQQVRALNLVDSLAKGGVLSSRSRVAVVGGGIAGLTAAAALAVRGVRLAQVYEKEMDTMRLQRGKQKRYIHPHIYDWPYRSAMSDAANLPLMSWEAGYAYEVIEQLDEAWTKTQKLTGERLPDPQVGCNPLAVDVKERKVTVRGRVETFDVIILAVGFGEEDREDTHAYWTDTSIDDRKLESPKESWFVSGYGDGALTDLMRLCIMDFLHSKVIKRVDDTIRELDEADRKKAGEKIEHAESPDTSPGQRVEDYEQAARLIENRLEPLMRFRPERPIWLNCTKEELFSPKASVLNRLIIAFLLNKKRFNLLRDAWNIEEVKRTKKGYRISFKEKHRPSKTVDHVIIRHGPKKALEVGFPEIWNACESVCKEWASARQDDDWTRKPLYNDSLDFGPDSATIPPLRVDFGEKVGCVLITGSKSPKGESQEMRVSSALKLFAGEEGTAAPAILGRHVETKPVHIRAIDALASSAFYERTVRALCECEIAVFDITGFECAVMLFLGIRSAVRRGVTLTLLNDDSTESPLPFNLSSLAPILMKEKKKEDDKSDIDMIAEALESGFTALQALPEVYLDLPAFDAVRRFEEPPSMKRPQEQILILRCLNSQYTGLVSNTLQTPLKTRFGKGIFFLSKFEGQSPQLVEQRLYAAIRHTQVCIADWTGWRPNVFFEIGVRLAVNPYDPVMVLCTEKAPGWDDQRSEWPSRRDESMPALRNFFDPTPFHLRETEQLGNRLSHLDENVPSQGTKAKISPRRTYLLVAEVIEWSREPGARPVLDLLLSEAKAIAGTHVPEAGDLKVLFNETLAEHARLAALELVVAAWYYLDGKYKLTKQLKEGQLASSDPHLGTLREVGLELWNRSRFYRDRPEFKDVLGDVLTILETWEPKRDWIVTDIVNESRNLKAKAILERDQKNFGRALELIEEAERGLRSALIDLENAREAGKRQWRSETEPRIAKQLAQILGSKGGIYRRMEKYKESADAYDAGYKIERPESGYGIIDSYNLVQRLVSRVFMEPAATQEPAAIVRDLPLRRALEEARDEVTRQREGPRGDDVYAAADLAILCLLLGDEGWHESVHKFINQVPSPDPYAIKVTREVTSDLLEALARISSPHRDLENRLRQTDHDLGQIESSRG
jgi:hypothetical protein